MNNLSPWNTGNTTVEQQQRQGQIQSRSTNTPTSAISPDPHIQTLLLASTPAQPNGTIASTYQVGPVVPAKRPRPIENSFGVSTHRPQGFSPKPHTSASLPHQQSVQRPTQQTSINHFQMYPNTPQNVHRAAYNAQNFPHQFTGMPQDGSMANQAFNPQLNAQQQQQLAINKRMAVQSGMTFSPAGQSMFMAQPGSSMDSSSLMVDMAQANNATTNPNTMPAGYPAYAANGMPIAPPNAMNPQGIPTNMQAQMMQAQLRNQQRMLQQQNMNPHAFMNPSSQQAMASLMQSQQPSAHQHQQKQQQSHLEQVQQQSQQQQQQQSLQQSQPQQEQSQQQQHLTQEQQQGSPQHQQQQSAIASLPQQQQHQGNGLQMSTTNLNMRTAGAGSPPTKGTINPEHFARSLQEFMIKRGTPISNMFPMVGDRQISLMQLYASVMRFGGSRMVGAGNNWGNVALSLNMNVAQNPQIVDYVKQIYAINLSPFEEAWAKSQTQRNAVAKSAGTPTSANTQNDMAAKQASMAQNLHMARTPQEALLHGRSTTNTEANLAQGTIDNSGVMPPMSSKRSSMSFSPRIHHTSDSIPLQSNKEVDDTFKPKLRSLDTYGGMDISSLSAIGADVSYLRPVIPQYDELGIIDVQALILSLQSGLRAEVRLALDTLISVSIEPQWSLSLKSCEDLVETLVDVAQDNVDFLADHARETSVYISIPGYETILRQSLSDGNTLLDVPKMNSLHFDLKRAVDHLIGITTILRNLSFFESNHASLADAEVIKFVADMIETFGRHKDLFRSAANTLDFMKDLVTFLSNLSQAIVLPGEHEALCLLELLLAFAPENPVMNDQSGSIFVNYEPAVHRYLPAAVDSFAKLLARDDPNRAYFKNIFYITAHDSIKSNILTRAFNLAIAPVPSSENSRGLSTAAVEARKPYLEQGLLAANILCDMLPQNSEYLAQAWLASEDGFALSLLKFVCVLGPQQGSVNRHNQARYQNTDDAFPFSRLAKRAMMVLRKLAHRADRDENYLRSVDNPPTGYNALEETLHSNVSPALLPKREVLLGALLTPHIDATMVKQLCLFASTTGHDLNMEE